MLKSDLFVSTLGDTGIQCFLYPSTLTEDFTYTSLGDWPKIMIQRFPTVFREKIIIEINDGKTILFKLCEKCLGELYSETDFQCSYCKRNKE